MKKLLAALTLGATLMGIAAMPLQAAGLNIVGRLCAGLRATHESKLGPYGISVNVVAPGAIVSESEERVFGHKAEEYSNWVIDRQCLKVRLQPEAVADLAHSLALPASDMITGQNIGIDAGW